jgi:hypothetical protein
MKRIDAFASEDELVESLHRLRQKVNNIESVSGRSLHTTRMRNEISRLEALQVYAGVRVRPAYRDFFQDRPQKRDHARPDQSER